VTVAGSLQRGAVLARTRDLLRFARQHGYHREDLLAMIRALP
jgi:hypothetical protein